MPERPMFTPGAGVGKAIAPPVPTERQEADFVFDPTKPIPTPEPVVGPVKAWSFSALMNDEQCPYRTFLKVVKRTPEPDSPAAARGTAIHTLAEDFVKGEILEMPVELKQLSGNYRWLREQYEAGKVSLEGEWAFDADWTPTGWRDANAWARIKADAVVYSSPTAAMVIDHKTGRKFGNELKHQQQTQLYAIATFLRDPALEYVETALWYIDHGEATPGKYTRDQAMMFLPRWTLRGNRMTSRTEFPPKPSKTNCKWCPFAETKACEWRYSG